MFNNVTLIGRLGKDPDVFTFDNNRKKASFTMATSKTFKKDNEKVVKTTWHNIVCFTPLAEVAESFLKKGAMVCIVGEINVRKFEDKDGNERTTTEVVAERLVLLNSRKDEDAEAEPQHREEISPSEGTDDLPF